MKTALDLNRQAWRAYQPCRAIDEAQTATRWEHAWHLARRAAALLRTRFGARRVVAFGSITRRDWFTPWSDVYLAVWGIAPDHFFRAVAAAAELGGDFGIHVLDGEDCSPDLQRVIAKEGIACE